MNDILPSFNEFYQPQFLHKLSWLTGLWISLILTA